MSEENLTDPTPKDNLVVEAPVNAVVPEAVNAEVSANASANTVEAGKNQVAKKAKNPLNELMNEGEKPVTEEPAQKGVDDFSIDKIVVPEGFQIADEMKGKLLDVVKQHGFSQTQIQALVDLQIQSQQDAFESYFDTEQAKIAKYPVAEKQMAIKGIKRFIPQEFQEEYLGENSVMTEPMMRLAIALGKASAEGSFVTNGGVESKEDKTIRDVQKMFKTMN